MSQQILRNLISWFKSIQGHTSIMHPCTFRKQTENEGQRTVPHEVTVPMNEKSMEDWCNFEQSPKRGSPNSDVSVDAVSDGDILDSESVQINVKYSAVTVIQNAINCP
jgi:hypothetical protein